MNVKLMRMILTISVPVERTHIVLTQSVASTASVLMVLDQLQRLWIFQLTRLRHVWVSRVWNQRWRNTDYSFLDVEYKCLFFIFCLKTSMSVWRLKTCVDQTLHVITRFRLIPAFVRMDSFPLEWSVFTMEKMSHVEVRCQSVLWKQRKFTSSI